MPIVTNFEKNLDKKKKPSTSKIVGLVLLIVATIGYLGLFIKWIPFLHDFFIGTFGLFSYVLFLLMYMIGGALLKGAKYVYSKKYIVYLSMALISVLAVFHIAFTYSIDLSSYGSYLGTIYSKTLSVGGVLLGLIIYPLQKYLYPIGAIFFFLIILAFSIWLIYDYLTRVRYLKQTDTKMFNKKIKKTFETPSKNANVNFELSKKPETKIGLDAEIEQEQKSREDALKKLGLDKTLRDEHFVDNKQLNSFANDFMTNKKSSQIFGEQNDYAPSGKAKSILQPPTDFRGTFGYNLTDNVSSKSKKDMSNYDKNLEFLQVTLNGQASKPKNNATNENYQTVSSNSSIVNTKKPNNDSTINDFLDANFGDYRTAEQTFSNKKSAPSYSSTQDYSNDYSTVNSNDEPVKADDKTFSNSFETIEQTSSENTPVEDTKSEKTVENVEAKIDNSVDQLKTNLDDTIDLKNFELPEKLKLPKDTSRRRGLKLSENQNSLFDVQPQTDDKETKKPHFFKHYVPPTVDLLSNVSVDSTKITEEVEVNARAIETTLENFGIPAKVTNTTIGPAVTRYELDMPAGISVNMVVKYSNDISAAVASSHGVRIQAPIPGKSAVGVEVPNRKVSMVGIREVLESKEFLVNKNVLSYAVGKEVSGKCVVADMHEMPHMLVAGSTGSGKSVALNTLIVSLIYKYGPEDLRFILVDPKQVEFYSYNGLPHMLLPEAIIDPAKSLNALDWAIGEMERRYTLLRDAGVREIIEYNSLPEVKSKQKEKLAHIVIIIDEVGDIMTLNNIKKDFEEKVRRLTQKARAVGINLILATQRPSVDVITGVIKANLPSRMAFAVLNYQDSKTILDTGGAEKLLGKGDMLFSPRGIEPFRVQGCYISTQEINNVCAFVKEHNESYYDEEIEKAINKQDDTSAGADLDSGEDSGNGFDPLMPECLKLVIKNGCASASMLQRRFSIGNPKASRIIDQMEVAKFIGPSNGSKPRTVYITAEQFKEIFGEGIDD